METRITKLLGCRYPVIQGGMAWVAEYHLAAAVSEAGGIGLIGAASAPAEVVREQIRKVKELTDKPFGVNVMLLNPNAPDVAKVIVEELSANDISDIAKNIQVDTAGKKKKNQLDEVDMTQMSLFDTVKDDDIIAELGSIDISHLTPIEAMNKLYELQNKVKNRW